MTALADLQLSVASLTDPGLKRTVNEDSYLATSPVFLVADGMGGYEAGDRASAAVVAAFRTAISEKVDGGYVQLEQVRDALLAADDGVDEVAGGTSRGAGSTVSGVVLVEHDDAPHWLVFNVGDSRVYRHVGSELSQVTVDHSLGQELVDRGELRREDLNSFPDRNIITRAIGAPDSLADSWLLPVVNGERLLICTDGLHSEVDDEGIRAMLTMGGRPESAAEALMRRAKRNGGRDNITIIVLDVVSGGSDAHGDYTTGSLARGPLTGSDAASDADADADTVQV